MSTQPVHRLHLEEVAQPPTEAGDAPLLTRDIGLIRNVSVRMSACVGHASVTVEQLFKLKGGDVLSLDTGVDQPVVFYLDDKPVARGMLVAVEDNFGVHITEVL